MGSAIAQPSQKYSPASTTSLILCTARGPSCTGMSARVWKRANFLRLVRTWPPSRRTTKRSASKLLRVKVRRRVMGMSSEAASLRSSRKPQTLLLDQNSLAKPTGEHDEFDHLKK